MVDTMYESFFSMTATPFVRNIPVDMLYRDRMTDEIHDRLLYAAQHQWFGLLERVSRTNHEQTCGSDGHRS